MREQIIRNRQPGRRRLRALAGLVPPGARVADIGSGHALLPRILLTTGQVAFCIATEMTSRSMDTERNAPTRSRRGRIEYRYGNGLDVLKPADRIDTVVVAGMGTPTILGILEERQIRTLGIRLMVLQPQTDPALLRRELAAQRCSIVAERLVLEGGRYYPVIAAVPGSSITPPEHPLLSTEDLYEAGPCLVRSGDPLVRSCWQERLDYHETVLGRREPGPGRNQAAGQRDLARRILNALPDTD